MEVKSKKRKLNVNRSDDVTETISSEKIDNFVQHFETNFDESFWTNLKNQEKFTLNSARLGDLLFSGCSERQKSIFQTEFDDLQSENSNVRKFLLRNWRYVSKSLLNLHIVDDNALTALQQDVWKMMDKYLDFCFTSQTLSNLNEFRSIYLLHALNHVIKGRQKILLHNVTVKEEREKWKTKSSRKKRRKQTIVLEDQKICIKDADKIDDLDSDDRFRDQGFTRPRVLILTPFRSGALKIVEILSALLFGDKEKAYVRNRNRFYEEYGFEEAKDDDGKVYFPRPPEYKEMFSGNTDDCFRIGLSVAKKSLKLYTEFYASDIIIASPLGVRSSTGVSDDKDFNADFLSSIEIAIFDQSDVFLMQNWSHVIHVLENLNKTPDKSHDVDFNRVRHWSLDGRAKFYRQTLLFSSVNTPEMKNMFRKFCHNFEGCVFSCPNYIDCVVSKITVELPQAFYRISSENTNSDADSRFEFFTSTILPQYMNSPTTLRHTLIFVSSYFDFVRLRNSLKTSDASFVQICEYAEEKKVSRARDLFYHEKRQFMLFTERFHFFKRYKIRGIRNLIFYQLPVYPEFYSEICNMLLEDPNPTDHAENVTRTCTVLFSRYDSLRLAPIVGNEKARLLLENEKNLHMLVAGN